MDRITNKFFRHQCTPQNHQNPTAPNARPKTTKTLQPMPQTQHKNTSPSWLSASLSAWPSSQEFAAARRSPKSTTLMKNHRSLEFTGPWEIRKVYIIVLHKFTSQCRYSLSARAVKSHRTSINPKPRTRRAATSDKQTRPELLKLATEAPKILTQPSSESQRLNTP